MVSALFVSQLNRLDRALFVKLDKVIQRFVVYRRDRQNKPREILKIEMNGQFCYPNYEHIAKLYSMDSWANKDMIKKMDEHNDNLSKESDEHIHFLSNEMSKLATRSAYY